MHAILLGLMAGLLVVACGLDNSELAVSPSPIATAAAVLVPLPGNIAGIPEGANPNTALVAPRSRRGELQVGVGRHFPLGHCGLASPIDIDGSLWDPVSGQRIDGAPLSDDHIGELINATRTAIVLADDNTLQMTTPLGALVTLTRHEGPRRYFLCG